MDQRGSCLASGICKIGRASYDQDPAGSDEVDTKRNKGKSDCCLVCLGRRAELETTRHCMIRDTWVNNNNKVYEVLKTGRPRRSKGRGEKMQLIISSGCRRCVWASLLFSSLISTRPVSLPLGSHLHFAWAAPTHLFRLSDLCHRWLSFLFRRFPRVS